MKRWKIKYENGQELLWYSSEKPQNISIVNSDIINITEYTNTEYMDYINLIQNHCDLLGTYNRNNSIHEIYKGLYYKGTMYIELLKDCLDDTYYDFALYQEHINNRILTPITKTVSNPKEVWNILSIKQPEYIVYSHRYYGEPKLFKPKELKNIKSIGNAEFYPKKCNPKIYIKDNDIYIQHTDYFSSIWKPPVEERVDMPLSYYTKKYFKKERNEKFVYPDGWGSIVLRDEAWIQLKNIIPLIKTENENIFAKTIINLQKYDKYSHLSVSETEMHWYRFWCNVYKCIENYLNEIPTAS